MKKLWFGVLVVLLGVFVFAAVPSPGHSASEVYVYINGKSLTLQQAAGQGEFLSSFSGGSYPGSLDFGHDEVYVNVGGASKTLQAAINDKSICNTGSGSYSGDVVKGHSADDISISLGGEKTLQQAINDGSFGASWSPSTSSYCFGEAFTQKKCGESRTAYGTAYCPPPCSPKTCSQLGKNCGYVDNGCGTNIYCGSCSSGQTCSSGSCVSSCTSRDSLGCYNGDVYWYDSCGVKGDRKKSCYLAYGRGGCWEGYCVRKLTRHASSVFEDHMISPCGVIGGCEDSSFSNYGSAELSFYLLNDNDYPSHLRFPLYRKAKSYSSTDSDHMMTTNRNEASGDYILEGTHGDALRYAGTGTMPMYRMKLVQGGGYDHMLSFSTTEGSPRYAYEGPLGHAIVWGVST